MISVFHMRCVVGGVVGSVVGGEVEGVVGGNVI